VFANTGFYYGSLDVMYNTLEEWNEEKTFYSGVKWCCSEPIHIYEALFLFCMEGTGKAYQII
jgi:hypothetical protein